MFDLSTLRRLDLCYHSAAHGRAKADSLTVAEFKKEMRYFPDTYKENFAAKFK
jgi:hypothetical protein